VARNITQLDPDHVQSARQNLRRMDDIAAELDVASLRCRAVIAHSREVMAAVDALLNRPAADQRK
jgi:hypothetical protein